MKFDMHILKNWMGIEIKPYFDTMVAQALLDENQSKALKEMAPIYLKIPADRFSTLFGKVTFDKVPIKLNPNTRTGNLATFYAVKDTELTYKMAEFQAKAFKRAGLEEIQDLFYSVEMPFLEIVYRAEQRGVRMDVEYLNNTVAPQLHTEVEELRQKIWQHTGQINLNSPAQLSKALYEKLKLPKVNKKKPLSTDKKTLKKLKKQHEVIPLLLEYREKTKLTTAFADKLPKTVVDGRVHTSFNPVGTKCVGGDTLIVTNQGIQRIDALSNNRQVGIFTDINLDVFSTGGRARADGFYYNGFKDGYKFTLVDGTEITTSPNHPLLTNRHLNGTVPTNRKNKIFHTKLNDLSWEVADNLRNGDYIALKIGTELYGNKNNIEFESAKYTPYYASHKAHMTIPSDVTPELALWLGMYMADGSLHDANKGLSVRLTNDNKEVTDLFMELNRKLFNDAGSFIASDSRRSPYVSLSGKHVIKWLIDNCGVYRGARNKNVPDIILKGSKEVQQAFIKGLTLDSSVLKRKYKSLTFSSVSESMMKTLRVMLMNMGIYSSYTETSSYFSVTLTGDFLEKFLSEIGLIETEKLITLSKLRATNRRVGVLISNDYVLVKIAKKEKVYTELFDLHVPSTHSFVGNGVMNHNTGRMSSSDPKRDWGFVA